MSNPPPSTIRLTKPDRAFSLSAEERAQVRQGFDVDALERLLAAVEPGARPIILAGFQYPKERGQSGGVMTAIGDPALQPLLDEVWAPMWERMPAEMLDRSDVRYPGRDLARARRAARDANEER
jgi:hypothetical protein